MYICLSMTMYNSIWLFMTLFLWVCDFHLFPKLLKCFSAHKKVTQIIRIWKRPLRHIWLLENKQNKFGCIQKNTDFQSFSPIFMNCFPNISATIYPSEVDLYSKRIERISSIPLYKERWCNFYISWDSKQQNAVFWYFWNKG